MVTKKTSTSPKSKKTTIKKSMTKISEKPFKNEIQIFEDFTDDEVKEIYEIAQRKKVKKNEVVFKEKSRDNAVYIVLKGKFEVLTEIPETGPIAFAEISEGHVFGEMSFLDGKPRSATVKALNEGEILRITRQGFNKLRINSPEVATKFISDLARIISLRLRTADEFIIEMLNILKSHSDSPKL